MSRIFVVESNCGTQVMNEETFKGFIAVAVLNNHDIGDFHVTEIDYKLTLQQAIKLAVKLGCAACFCTNYASSNDVESAFKDMLKLTGKLKGIC